MEFLYEIQVHNQCDIDCDIFKMLYINLNGYMVIAKPQPTKGPQKKKRRKSKHITEKKKKINTQKEAAREEWNKGNMKQENND